MQNLELVSPLVHRTGEELLLLAIVGDAKARRHIHKELSLRARLGEPARRPHAVAARSHLRLERSCAA
jgi:hypothetical protein